MARAQYKVDRGVLRFVGWCVITKNLFSIARSEERSQQEPRKKTNEPVEGVLSPAAQATR
jgi:hypothetical protein